MFSKLLRRQAQRTYGSHVAVLGANGGIGQPLSLLMKMNDHVEDLRLFDISERGVATDLSHCSTHAKVTCQSGPRNMQAALDGIELVLMAAGVPRSPGMTRDDLFNTNASIVAGLAENCAKYCPNAWIGIISNPVNSMVPVAASIYKQMGVDPTHIFGICTLDAVRAETFVSEQNGSHVDEQHVPVVGGHAGTTIIPLLSRCVPPIPNFEKNYKQVEALTNRIQDAGTEVVRAKHGNGSATLSMAFAAHRFADKCLRAQCGETAISEYAYVASDITDSTYFSSRITLNREGIQKVHDLGDISDYEAKLVEESIPQLKDSIAKGEEFASTWFNKAKFVDEER